MVEKLVKSKPIFIESAFKFLTFEKDDLKTQCLKLNGGPRVMYSTWPQDLRGQEVFSESTAM